MQLIHKLGILLAILLASVTGNAQSNAQKIFDMYSGKQGFVSLGFAKSIIQPFEILLDDDSKRVLLKMDKVNLLFYNEDKGFFSSDEIYDRIGNEFNENDYFDIDPNEFTCNSFNIESDSDYEQIRIIGCGQPNKMNEFHILLCESDNAMLFSFFGDITVEDLKTFCTFSHSTKNTFKL
ncbi:MAG TPA: hypothetical protein PLS94_00220 [Prolixibacteraceae bacterium]|nr:hypothetical protein [Prolixibacteraceae bacterium]HPR60851.1 hypothetical protein [Prolixibacteraceae bacterium]